MSYVGYEGKSKSDEIIENNSFVYVNERDNHVTVNIIGSLPDTDSLPDNGIMEEAYLIDGVMHMWIGTNGNDCNVKSKPCWYRDDVLWETRSKGTHFINLNIDKENMDKLNTIVECINNKSREDIDESGKLSIFDRKVSKELLEKLKEYGFTTNDDCIGLSEVTKWFQDKYSLYIRACPLDETGNKLLGANIRYYVKGSNKLLTKNSWVFLICDFGNYEPDVFWWVTLSTQLEINKLYSNEYEAVIAGIEYALDNYFKKMKDSV